MPKTPKSSPRKGALPSPPLTTDDEDVKPKTTPKKTNAATPKVKAESKSPRKAGDQVSWTDHDDKVIIANVYEKKKSPDWAKIAELFADGRSANAVRMRFKNRIKPQFELLEAERSQYTVPDKASDNEVKEED